MMALLNPQLLLAKFGVYIAIGAGVLVAYFTWHKTVEHKGVVKERVRVEQVGKKIDAKAQAARRDAERKPHDSLRQYYRD